MADKFYSGFVSLVGRPNVGKSTLMNRLIGEKIAIISNKPQTTRNRVQSILTKNDFQIVFIDTPGIHRPRHKLGEYMVKSAETTLNEVDAVLMLIEPSDKILEADRLIIEKFAKVKSPVILVINKIDTVDRERVFKVIDEYRKLYDFAEIVPISAFEGTNTDELLSVIRKYLPEGPRYFPSDMVTDQPERQITSEIIREKALRLLDKEIPYGVAVTINKYGYRPSGTLEIDADVICQKAQHKPIILGKNGSMIKKISEYAREDLEAMTGDKILLTLWVRVKKDWRDDDVILANLGYDKNKDV